MTWKQLANVAYANSVAVGAASPWTGQQAVFLYGEASQNRAMAMYRSDDSGKSWLRINDNAHQYVVPRSFKPIHASTGECIWG